MTSPHFLYGEHYLQFVEGLKPIEEQHCTPLVYEPVSIFVNLKNVMQGEITAETNGFCIMGRTC